ncbi:Uncharacterised protein [Salmonella enterica subsp. enterica]|nr:Uncharacterised protein [Salmonella enterica subsp. enterica]
MRGERVKHTHDGLQRFLKQCAVLFAFLRGFRQFVHQLHDRRNGGVERLTTADIIGHFGNGFMHIATQRFLIFAQRIDVQRRDRTFSGVFVNQLPDRV